MSLSRPNSTPRLITTASAGNRDNNSITLTADNEASKNLFQLIILKSLRSIRKLLRTVKSNNLRASKKLNPGLQRNPCLFPLLIGPTQGNQSLGFPILGKIQGDSDQVRDEEGSADPAGG